MWWSRLAAIESRGRTAVVEALTIGVVLMGCVEPEDSAQRVVALEVSHRALSLGVGDSVPVSVRIRRGDGGSEDGSSAVTWMVRDPEIAQVEVGQGGVRLRALRAGGSVLIAAGDGLSAQVPLAVRGQIPRGELSLSRVNPRYFHAANGEVVYFTGSHTWTGVQDDGRVDPPPAFDFVRFLDFVSARGHNLVRLWAWEQAAFATDVEGDYFLRPHPWLRAGPGKALDGKPRFDFDRFDDSYFLRMRERLEAARARDISVVVMLFNGWSVAPIGLGLENPWLGHPMHAANNVNGLDGDPNGDGDGREVHTLENAAVLAVQTEYVRRVVDTVQDFDNVLFEISNESQNESYAWQEHMIGVIRERERALGLSHPVGMTVQWPAGSNSRLFESSADWISPRRTNEDDPLEPMLADGSKVILYDTDHVCGTCGSVAWVWKSMTRGLQPLFMDSYDNHAVGLGAGTDTIPEDLREAIRLNMGWARVYADRLDLAHSRPAPDLASTPYVLSALDSPRPALVAWVEGDSIEIALPAVAEGFRVEWFRSDTGETIRAPDVEGGAVRTLVAPRPGPLVLYLESAALPGQLDETSPARGLHAN